ncbi:MAG: AgmX/PglI C-terminal domain-containing protein [Deltaproteobacteria bacterium]|nr:AgmX/PglI C-terminal domain-containing protein [Deltaproteobacteria bacterium]
MTSISALDVRRLGCAALVLLAAGCRPEAGWAPPPSAPIPPWPGLPEAAARPGDGDAGKGEDEGEQAAPVAGAAPLAGAPSARPPDASAPAVRIEIETPYKLGRRPEPADRAAYQADLLERRRWNDGAIGPTTAAPPGPEGHPDPRVTVSVEQARGPLGARRIERVARRDHWMNAVRCYRLGAYRDRHLHGWTRARLTVGASGKVSRAVLQTSELGDRAVAECLVDRLALLDFPRAARATRALVGIRVAPGDDPLPPPDELLAAGPGELAAGDMLAGAGAGLGGFETCYRAALAYAPQLWGRLCIRFHVDAQGAVDEAFETESRFPDARVKQCVLRAARQLHFARPAGGELRFVVPLRFSTTPIAPAAATE